MSRSVRSLVGPTRKSPPWGNFSDGGLNQSIKLGPSLWTFWLIDWLTISQFWLDWFIGFVRMICLYGGGARVTEHRGTIQFFIGIQRAVLRRRGSQTRTACCTWTWSSKQWPTARWPSRPGNFSTSQGTLFSLWVPILVRPFTGIRNGKPMGDMAPQNNQSSQPHWHNGWGLFSVANRMLDNVNIYHKKGKRLPNKTSQRMKSDAIVSSWLVSGSAVSHGHAVNVCACHAVNCTFGGPVIRHALATSWVQTLNH